MKTKEIALSREQMLSLQSKGVDISDASMCWIKEPNEKNFRLVVHDEYCYELGCLNPVPAYTLQDIVMMLKGELHKFDNELLDKYPCFKDTPWIYRIFPNHLPLKIDVSGFGAIPLEAAYKALLKVLEVAPERFLKLLAQRKIA